MFYYTDIIARSADIWGVASSRVSGIIEGTRYTVALATNVRREAKQRRIPYGTLRRSSGLARVRFARLWFGVDATVPDLLRVHIALGCSAAAIWAVR